MKIQERQSIFNQIPPIIMVFIILIGFVSIMGIAFPFMLKVFKFYGALYPDKLLLSESYRLITYGFLHSDYGHLGMNMLWLLIFASPIQKFFGTQSFLIIFTIGLITGGLIFLTYDRKY